jgi:ribosomal protein S18 acetylase RimI-like enzyme
MELPMVREVRPEDETQVAEVERLATAALREVYRPTIMATVRRAALVAQTKRLVAVIEERVVGVVQYYIVEGRLAFLGLGVHPQFRRRGVAAALIRELEAIGRDVGCTTVTLHTVRETGNVEIFQRLGFLVESEAPTDLFQGEGRKMFSEVVMRKDLVQN